MTEYIHCTVLDRNDVEVKGNMVTFSIFGEDVHSFYLSPEAIRALLEKLPGSLYDRMAEENIYLSKIIDANRKAIYGDE